MFGKRSIIYWLASFTFAVLAAKASELVASDSVDLTFGGHSYDLLPVPEPARAVMMAVGIMAVAFTYRKAWLNMKRGSSSAF